MSKTVVERFIALDILRGLTIIIMALDHSRDFFSLGFVAYAPTDIAITDIEVFLTRWITHFAAPTFMFLAGIGLYFASARRTKAELAKLAITRGLWLIFLELTLVGFFWCFSTDFIYHPKVAVLFALGIAMISMGVLIYLPKTVLIALVATMLLGHNMLDGITSDTLLWHLIHEPGETMLGGLHIRVVYPFVPWIGVMAMGFLFGPVTKMPRLSRQKIFLFVGLSFITLALLLRFFNIYGDPTIWNEYNSLSVSVMSFMNFTKYPPSLIYLGVLIGIAMVLLSVLDRDLGAWSNPLKDIGQVPFFFYVIHIPLLHLGGIALAYYSFGDASWLFSAPIAKSPEAYSYGSELLPTYLGWIAVILLMWYPSKLFAELKQKRKDWWLSYL